MNLTAVDSADPDLADTAKKLNEQGLTIVDRTAIVRHICQRFRFSDDLFDGLIFARATKAIIRAISRPIDVTASPALDRIGIDFLRIDMANPRMTTSAAMTWARYAQQNAVDTTAQQCEAFLGRKRFCVNDTQLDTCTGRGFVFIRHYGHGLGVGFLESTRRSDDNFRRVRSMYPRAYAADLENTSPFGNPL